MQFRAEVSELMSSMIEAGAGLLMPEDRLLVLMEAAQVTKSLLGSCRHLIACSRCMLLTGLSQE